MNEFIGWTKISYITSIIEKYPILILDEPTNYLDRETADYVIDFIFLKPKLLILIMKRFCNMLIRLMNLLKDIWSKKI